MWSWPQKKQFLSFCLQHFSLLEWEISAFFSFFFLSFITMNRQKADQVFWLLKYHHLAFSDIIFHVLCYKAVSKFKKSAKAFKNIVKCSYFFIGLCEQCFIFLFKFFTVVLKVRRTGSFGLCTTFDKRVRSIRTDWQVSVEYAFWKGGVKRDQIIEQMLYTMKKS